MPKRRGFKGEKRRKELVRLQKQEEKRQRRFGTLPEKEPATSETATETEERQEGNEEGRKEEAQ